jgi:CRISPR-associated protein Cas1
MGIAAVGEIQWLWRENDARDGADRGLLGIQGRVYLYVTRPDVLVARRGHRLALLEGERAVAEVGCVNLEGVVLFGAPITVQALRLLLSEQISLVMFDRFGRYRGRLEQPWSPHADLRERQTHVFRRSGLELCRELVHAKIMGEATVLERWFRRGEQSLRGTILDLKRAAERALNVANMDSLRGLEGAATRRYFAAVDSVLPHGFKRSRRPPKDELNALLSVGYSAALERSLAASSTVGFDPYRGFYHTRKYGRPALALDLMEPFRPLVERVVFGMARRQEVDLRWFERRDGGVFLARDAYRMVLERVADRFRKLQVYEGKTWPIAAIFVEQARSLARHVMGRGPFVPYRLSRD